VSERGTFGCSGVNLEENRYELELDEEFYSLLPGLAVAGRPRALALVHGGGLLLGRHPRQGEVSRILRPTPARIDFPPS
jgi:hypothetical protein